MSAHLYFSIRFGTQKVGNGAYNKHDKSVSAAGRIMTRPRSICLGTKLKIKTRTHRKNSTVKQRNAEVPHECDIGSIWCQ